MCQSLVDKVAQSEQLVSIVEMDLLVMFEDWLEELETEVLNVLKKMPPWMKKPLPENLDCQTGALPF
jgi:hypothetical protein